MRELIPHDPTTGSRYLEELAFEIVAEQSMPDITERAEDLSTRGVRRIIAVCVKTMNATALEALHDGIRAQRRWP